MHFHSSAGLQRVYFQKTAQSSVRMLLYYSSQHTDRQIHNIQSLINVDLLAAPANLYESGTSGRFSNSSSLR